MLCEHWQETGDVTPDRARGQRSDRTSTVAHPHGEPGACGADLPALPVEAGLSPEGQRSTWRAYCKGLACAHDARVRSAGAGLPRAWVPVQHCLIWLAM